MSSKIRGKQYMWMTTGDCGVVESLALQFGLFMSRTKEEKQTISCVSIPLQ